MELLNKMRLSSHTLVRRPLLFRSPDPPSQDYIVDEPPTRPLYAWAGLPQPDGGTQGEAKAKLRLKLFKKAARIQEGSLAARYPG